MEMRVPGGQDWLDVILSSEQRFDEMDTSSVVYEPSEEQLLAALDAMRRGDSEYVTLVDGDEFAQAAGDGDGPYVLEHYFDGKPTVTVSNAPFELVSSVLTKYHAGDGSWRQDLGAPQSTSTPGQSSGPVSEPKRGGFLSRLRGK